MKDKVKAFNSLYITSDNTALVNKPAVTSQFMLDPNSDLNETKEGSLVADDKPILSSKTAQTKSPPDLSQQRSNLVALQDLLQRGDKMAKLTERLSTNHVLKQTKSLIQAPKMLRNNSTSNNKFVPIRTTQNFNKMSDSKRSIERSRNQA